MGETPLLLLLVSAALELGGLEADGGLDEDEARFKAPFESILIGESCFRPDVGDLRFLGLVRLTPKDEFDDVDEADEKDGVMEMLGALFSLCGDRDCNNEMAAAAALFVS